MKKIGRILVRIFVADSDIARSSAPSILSFTTYGTAPVSSIASKVIVLTLTGPSSLNRCIEFVAFWARLAVPSWLLTAAVSTLTLLSWFF